MSAIRNLIYKLGWDTRCRNIDVKRVLLPLIGPGTTILDAGCGEYGLSAFVSGARITGVDILPAETVSAELNYVHGSIVDLPFDPRSFDVAVSVDVLEHLPEDMRSVAVKQLVKIAGQLIVITFPCGADARRLDEGFERELTRRGQPVPDWLKEHLQNRYPEIDEIVAGIEAEAKRTGRVVSTSVQYSENSTIARCLRWSAIRSKYLYLANNLVAGVFLPLMPKAGAANAYRAIVVAEFDRD